ncbi:MAG: tetratricopeptide repeat protein [Sphingobacterium sp.]|nr:tetratricopeptide repeat protein [Sphingobacterium sp.]
MDEIALHTAKALGVELSHWASGEGRAAGERTVSRAYSSYLEGWKIFEEMPDLPDLAGHRWKVQRAIEIYPNYALAHWGLGNVYENLYCEEHLQKDPAVLDKMYEHFTRASDLDPSFAETNLGLGGIISTRGITGERSIPSGKALDARTGRRHCQSGRRGIPDEHRAL